MSPRRQALSPFILIFMAAILSVFQNCTKGGGSNSSSSSTNTQNNGSGYDGKIFVHLNANAICSDNKPFDSAIQIRGGIAYLIRNNCTDIPEAAQQAVSVDHSTATPWLLTYNGEIYVVDLIGQNTVFSPNGDVLTDGFKYEVVGESLTFSGNFLARFDGSGKALFAKTHPWLGSERAHQAFFANGDALITHKFTPATGDAFTWMIRLDRAANVVWSKVIRDPNLMLTGVAVDASDKIYAVGAIAGSSNTYTAALLELSSGGQLTRARSFSGNGYFDGLLASGGGFYLEGTLNDAPWIVRLDANASVVWSESFAGLTGMGLYPSADGGVILKAFSESQPVSTVTIQHLRLLKIQVVDGSIAFTKKFASDTPSNFDADVLDDLYPSGDGGFLLVQGPANGQLDVIRLKADLSLDWSVQQTFSTQMQYSTLLALPQGGFWADFQLDAQLRPYFTDVLTPISFTGWPQACSTCSPLSHSDTQTIANPNVVTGAEPAALSSLTVEDVVFPAFTDFSIYLPLY